MSAPTPAPLVVHRRHDKSLLMGLLHALIRPLRPRLVKAHHKDLSSSEYPRLSPPKKLLRDHDVNERCVDNIWIYDIAKRVQRDKDPTNVERGHGKEAARRIYYFAGGGWQMPPSPHHWSFAGALSSRLPQTTLSLISYPLAPQCPASISMPRLKTLYSTIMEQSADKNERVIIAGDSSGVNIALSLVLWALATEAQGEAASKGHPAAIMAISPTTDLRHVNTDIRAAARHDPTLTAPFIDSTAAAWCGTRDHPAWNGGGERAQWTAEDPRVSPILAPIERIVERGIQMHGVIGTFDVLAPEAMVFMERCRELGVGGKWLVWEGQMHCFPLAFRYGLKESVQAVDWIVDVLGQV
ncbi:alpha/beta hydrolase fold domain-containing protein [Hirsutella rhossiliensis]|uniref:Alpha/beta hydrolase fold domain-containing protein n=1 Tax=Hirsutella rhossiliensis TaxID=111463 RepID=A0A9P8SLW5_9HYPO|nr:alpha/beta hydrolase fold domain-containing protein [Hirsutella rhossiliensis]KAH0967366.1 alpha/beta hydrolase fold domain-containing protein [Hirsutella rhossiliensis]